MTWPEPRVVEVACQDNPEYPESSVSESGSDLSDNQDPVEFDFLRLTSRLESWLQKDFSIMSDDHLERCLDPVALHVCQESRMHTLRRYTCFQHPRIESSGFYIDPQSDILSLGHDFDSEILAQIRHYYGDQLGRIERVLVKELGLWWYSADDACNMLDSFEGLRIVRVILESYQFSTQDKTIPTMVEYSKTANEIRARDEPSLRERIWRVEYTDREGNVYCHCQQPPTEVGEEQTAIIR